MNQGEACTDFLVHLACISLGAVEAREHALELVQSVSVSCNQGCGVLYCSEACRDAAEEAGHDLLCAGRCKSEDESLFNFKLHAMEYNDGFLLAGQVFASILKRALRAGNGLDCNDLLWEKYDVLIPRGRSGASDHNERPYERESYKMLMDAFKSLPELENYADSLMTFLPFTFFVALLQKFVCNNAGVRIQHPVCNKLRANEKLFVDQLAFEMGKVLNSEDEEPLCGNDLIEFPDYYFSPVDGEALYPKLAAANHSCNPNAAVSFECGGSARVSLVALRNLADGDEICHDYAKFSNSREERRAALRQYGISCDCARCCDSLT